LLFRQHGIFGLACGQKALSNEIEGQGGTLAGELLCVKWVDRPGLVRATFCSTCTIPAATSKLDLHYLTGASIGRRATTKSMQLQGRARQGEGEGQLVQDSRSMFDLRARTAG